MGETETWETWDIQEYQGHCWWRDDEWCTYKKKKCLYSNCPKKVKGTHKLIDTYGNTVKKL